MRIAVFGANGLTGRLLTDQALPPDTRSPRSPGSRSRFHCAMIGSRWSRPTCSIRWPSTPPWRSGMRCCRRSGYPLGKEPISTYSQGVANIAAAMKRHRVRRLAVVSSSGVDPHPYSDGGFLFNRLLLPYVTRVLGKTLYDDMRRMETLVRAGDLDWTIVRPSGLYHLPSVTGYTLVKGHADGRFTARADLAASMLALLDDDRYLRATVGVITTVDNPTLLQWIRREALAKS